MALTQIPRDVWGQDALELEKLIPVDGICRMCGNWRCADCGVVRGRRNRFSASPQQCSTCTSPNGRMEPTRHRPGRVLDCYLIFLRLVAGGLAARYPVEEPLPDAALALIALVRGTRGSSQHDADMYITHEPALPVDWPNGHVSVEPGDSDVAGALDEDQVDVTLTNADVDECMLITIGDYRHYLHSTTTRELSNMLRSLVGHRASVTVHGMRHSLQEDAVTALDVQLRQRIAEWNARARSLGFPGV